MSLKSFENPLGFSPLRFFYNSNRTIVKSLENPLRIKNILRGIEIFAKKMLKFYLSLKQLAIL